MVSDYRLAEGANGIAALEALQQDLAPDVPAAILTGDIAPSVLKAVDAAGFPLLTKPVHPRRLVATLESLLASRIRHTSGDAQAACEGPDRASKGS
jgi:CheY-like chemotaxis protein